MKKGFTLIELLAVILVLSIIAVIAINVIANIFLDVRVTSKLRNNEAVLKSTELYLLNNPSLFPNSIGETVKVDISTLNTNNFLKSIKYLGQNCDGHVLVTKTDVEKFSYNSNLLCGKTLSDDKLILHYKFDDFQEPTENLIDDVYGNVYSGYIGLTVSDVDDYETPTKKAKKIITNIDNVNSAARIRFGTDSKIVSGKYYYVTIYIKKDPSVNDLVIPRVYSGYTWYDMIALDDLGDNYVKNHYRRFGAYIFTGTSSGGPNPGFSTFAYTGNIGDTFYYSSPQVEEKEYETPFVEGIRTSNITDYSNNNKISILNNLTSPKFINNAYSFDGNSNYITMPNDLVSVSNIRQYGVTYSAWINTSLTNVNQRIFGQQTSVGYSDYSSGGIAIEPSGKVSMIAYSDANPSSYVKAISKTTIEANKWYHVVGIFDPVDSKIKIYLNGNFESEEAIGTFSRLISNISNRIGNKENPTTYPYHGLIDELRIYGRNISEEEIKYLYQLGR